MSEPSPIATYEGKLTHFMMDFVEKSRTNCLYKGIISGLAGVGMGISFGVFMGTFEGCHGDIPGNNMKEQLTYATKQTIRVTWRRCKNYGLNFGFLGCILTGMNCYLARIRGKDDQLNSTVSGALTGAAFGIYASRRLPAGQMLKTTAKYAAGFVAFGWVIDYVMDSFQERAVWTRAFTTKHSI